MRALSLLTVLACAPTADVAPTAMDLAPPPLVLSVPDIFAGQPVTLSATGANPGDRVTFVGSTNGFGSGPCPNALGGQCIGFANAVRLGSDIADAQGYAELTLNVPNALQGNFVWLQAAVAIGANSYLSFDTLREVVNPACPMILADFEAETDSIRSCTTASECGQILAGTSCGCTRDWVARTNADPTDFYALLNDANQCGGGLISTCDCPPANGFDCVNNTCTWNYN